MRQQYGLRVQSEEFADMGWNEFADLLTGLNEDTVLVRVATIRTERNREAIKNFTTEQRRIYTEWQRRKAHKRSEGEVSGFLAQMQQGFAEMCKEA